MIGWTMNVQSERDKHARSEFDQGGEELDEVA